MPRDRRARHGHVLTGHAQDARGGGGVEQQAHGPAEAHVIELRSVELAAHHGAGHARLREEEGENGVVERQHPGVVNRQEEVEIHAAHRDIRSGLLEDELIRRESVAEHGQVTVDDLHPDVKPTRSCGRHLNGIPINLHHLIHVRGVQRQADRAAQHDVAAEVRPEDDGVAHRPHQAVLVEVEAEARVLQTDDAPGTGAQFEVQLLARHPHAELVALQHEPVGSQGSAVNRQHRGNDLDLEIPAA